MRGWAILGALLASCATDAPAVRTDAVFAPPTPVAVEWAPPPLLAETPPDPPSDDAIWVAGHWTWAGDWVWAPGLWTLPPRAGWSFVPPYYENRAGEVIFIGGFWAPRGYVFVPPSRWQHVRRAWVRPGVVAGARPMGPPGVFVPAPPGARRGAIASAPIARPPHAVTRAPVVVPAPPPAREAPPGRRHR
jgi:hypothetical protein